LTVGSNPHPPERDLASRRRSAPRRRHRGAGPGQGSVTLVVEGGPSDLTLSGGYRCVNGHGEGLQDCPTGRVRATLGQQALPVAARRAWPLMPSPRRTRPASPGRRRGGQKQWLAHLAHLSFEGIPAVRTIHAGLLAISLSLGGDAFARSQGSPNSAKRWRGGESASLKRSDEILAGAGRDGSMRERRAAMSNMT